MTDGVLAHPTEAELQPIWQPQELAEPTAGNETIPQAEISGEEPGDALRSGPLPVEWEDSLFAVLETKDMSMRNFGLIQLATVTARHVPRVQAECLAHLTYALEEKDYAQFLSLARNEALPLESRLQFLEETFRIRRLEFSVWVAQNLANDPHHEVAAVAKQFLAEQKARASSRAKGE